MTTNLERALRGLTFTLDSQAFTVKECHGKVCGALVCQQWTRCPARR